MTDYMDMLNDSASYDDDSDYVQPTPTLAVDSSSQELSQEVSQESMDVCGI